MTAVANRRMAGPAGGTHAESLRRFQEPVRPAVPSSQPAVDPLDADGTPMHCGAKMTSTPSPTTVLPWAQFHTGQGEWVCTCGFRRPADSSSDPLAAVRAAGARLESLQWEIDAAEAALAAAVRTATEAGVDAKSLMLETGLTSIELLELQLR